MIRPEMVIVRAKAGINIQVPDLELTSHGITDRKIFEGVAITAGRPDPEYLRDTRTEQEM